METSRLPFMQIFNLSMTLDHIFKVEFTKEMFENLLLLIFYS